MDFEKDLEKKHLFEMGMNAINDFCFMNDLDIPQVAIIDKKDWRFNVCAWYRDGKIAICLEKCSSIGRVGRSWSYPGYTADRTPFGVLLHELGHHVDFRRSDKKARYGGDFSIRIRRSANENPISGYCPNDFEWFAEMFRVFVSNPDLLRGLRHLTFEKLASIFKVEEIKEWREVLKEAPNRTIVACENKLRLVGSATKKFNFQIK